MTGLRLYGKSGCHLCEEAEILLRQAGLMADVEKVDISADVGLGERYGVRIPVLARVDDGRELDWPFTRQEVDLLSE